MKRQWLYHPETGKGTLFESEEAIAKAIEDGYEDTPAKCGGCKAEEEAAKKAEGGSDIDPTTLSIDELKDGYTVKELKEFAKNLGITGMSNKNQDEVAQAIFDYEPNEDL